MKISYPSIKAEEVIVNRDLTPEQAISATGRVQYTNSAAVATMPKGGKGTETVTVEFFNLGQFVGDDQLAKEYEKRGLTPDPYAQAAVNQADPVFADQHPNGTHWKDDKGNWNFATFSRRDVERGVDVFRGGYGWNARWWVGGVCKLSA